MKTNIIFLLAFSIVFAAEAQDYKASVFGCRSDGVTNNTGSIQSAIDIISERGGGELHFYVGRYLTGTVWLKNNVTIVLHEGATLVGVPSIYDYSGPTDAPKAIIVAEGQKNIGVVGSIANRMDTEVVGKGIIQGQGAATRKSIEAQIAKGYLKESIGQAAPSIVSFSGCTDVKVTGLVIQSPANDVFVFRNCTNVSASRHIIESQEVADCNGIVFSGCNNITVADNFFTLPTGKPIKQGAGNKNVKTSGNKTKAGLL